MEVMNSISTSTYPLFSRYQDIGHGFIAPTNGMICVLPSQGNWGIGLFVDGVEFGYSWGHSGSSHGQPRNPLYAPIGKGQKMSIKDTDYVHYRRFVPYAF